MCVITKFTLAKSTHGKYFSILCQFFSSVEVRTRLEFGLDLIAWSVYLVLYLIGSQSV